MTNADYFSTAYLDLATVPRLRFSTIRNKRIARTQAGRSVLIKELKSSDMQRQNTKLDKNEDIILSDACSNIKSVSTPTIARATLSSSSNVAMPSPIYVEPNSLYSSTTSTPTEEKPGNNINSNVRSLSGNKGLSEKHKPKSQLTHIKKQQVSHKTIKNLKQSLGITGTHTKLRKSMDWSDIAGKSRVPFDDLVTILEQGSRSRTPLFPNQSLEEQFVRYQLAWRTELQRLIEKSEIVKTTFLELEPMGEEDLIIVYTPKKDTNTHIQSAPKNQNAWIAFRLLDFDRTAIDASEFETLLGFNRSFIPVRKVILRAQLCRSSMDLGQKNINFGVVDRNERHHKTIILHNRTETPLLYTIKKSGSIASGDIKFGMGRHGVVRGFGKREIEFLFEPTLPGSFMEHLEVINIRDKEDTNVISLKANIRRPVLFSIRLTELSFGPCILGKVCDRIETVIITNTNKQSRLFEVRLDPDDAANTTLLSVYNVKVDYTIDEQSEAMNMPLSKEEEEEIENLEQKLKIARRKGQPDKIKKYQKKLARLKKISNDEEEEENSTENTKGDYQAGSREHEIEVEEKKDTNQVVKTASTFTYKKEEGRIIFSLGSNATKKISVHFTVTSKKSIQGDDSTFSIATGRILVNEHRNIDSYKSVMFSTTICHDDASFLQQKKLFEQHPSDPL
jgi:hypothetical protein